MAAQLPTPIERKVFFINNIDQVGIKYVPTILNLM